LLCSGKLRLSEPFRSHPLRRSRSRGRRRRLGMGAHGTARRRRMPQRTCTDPLLHRARARRRTRRTRRKRRSRILLLVLRPCRKRQGSAWGLRNPQYDVIEHCAPSRAASSPGAPHANTSQSATEGEPVELARLPGFHPDGRSCATDSSSTAFQPAPLNLLWQGAATNNGFAAPASLTLLPPKPPFRGPLGTRNHTQSSKIHHLHTLSGRATQFARWQGHEG
jgi:hypothetical protein